MASILDPDSGVEPLDGPEYTRVVENIEFAYRLDPYGLGANARTAARLVATIEATRRMVDELRDASGLTDVIRQDLEGT